MSNSAEAQDATDLFSGKVTPDWIERGMCFSAAWQFGNPGFVNEARAAAERFKELRSENIEDFEASSPLSGAARDKQLLNRLYGEDQKAWLDYYINRNAAQRDVWFKLAWEGGASCLR